MRFEIGLLNNFHDEIRELKINFEFQEDDEGNKLLIINNQRVSNLVNNGVLKASNLDKELHKYLEFGLVLLLNDFENSLTIYNDIYGAYPLFIDSKNKKKVIRNNFEFDKTRKLNEFAIVQLIHFNHILGKNTLISDIERIQGGQKMVLNNEGIKFSSFFSWDDFLKATEKIISESSEKLMTNAIEESKISKFEPVLTLTGGFDSRLLFALIRSKTDHFSTITWGAAKNTQTSRAKEIASEFKIKHQEIELGETFRNEVPRFLDYILSNGSETPFITDIPQFIYMCEQLNDNTDLICGFMGSEIVRGPSYSSQVTLTKFAADIGLATSKEQIKNIIIEFNNRFPYITQEFIERNMDQIIEDYSVYSKINDCSKFKNANIFKYLFYEKFPKIYGPIINYHHNLKVNLINPYMDFKFIVKTLKENKALSEMTPYENGSLNNFYSYRFYAKEIKKIHPDLMHTKMDRGYKLKDLISPFGIMKLIPYQVYRKFKKKNIAPVKVVDSNLWYADMIQKNVEINSEELKNVLNGTFINESCPKINSKTDLDKIKFQLILGLLMKIK
jgi:hypothetical protein